MFGWLTIDMDSTVCDPSQIATLAQSAARSTGVDLAAYARYVYAFPKNACTWWGLGTVGGTPSQAWINGTLAFRVAGHELGHNLGLMHAHSLDCGATVIGSSCTATDYGDTVDIMGGSSAHFNAFNKDRLGWLNHGVSPPITTVETSGDYWIGAYELPVSDTKALKILKSVDPSTGQRTWYYVEYRQPVGFDAYLRATPTCSTVSSSAPAPRRTATPVTCST